jgi:plasmid stabilization system protein ParE
VARVIHSEEAVGDLERLTDFLLGESPESASDAVEAILEEIRELVISRGATGYLALYRFHAPTDTVRILRIRHQREGGYADTP